MKMEASYTNMDKDLRRGKTYMKDAQVAPPSPEQVPLNPWDSLESDTESLAQEKAYQQELQTRIGSNRTTNCIQTQEGKTSSLHQTEEHEANEAEEEDPLKVDDSLDVAAQEFEKNNPLLSTIEASNAPLDTNERDLSRQSSDDAYSDLRYDPNWRTNLKEAGRFNESPRLSFEEDTKYDSIISEQRCNENEVLSMKGGCQYVVIRGPALAEAPHSTTANESEQPYHLHQQHGEASTVVSVTSPHPPHVHQHYTLDERSERKLREVRNEETHNHVSSFPEHRDEEKIPAGYDEQENLSYSQHELGQSHQVAKKQSQSKWKNPELFCNRKLGTQREDVVKRNRITLGRDTAKCGSYLKAYTMKQETHNQLDQVSDIPEEVILMPTEGLKWSPEDSSDPELRWLQKTQQLKVIQFTKQKKDKQKGSHKPSSQNIPPTLVAGARPGGHVIPRAAEAHTSALSQPVILLSDTHMQLSRIQHVTSMPSELKPEHTLLAQASPVEHQPALPTINLSINLSTSSELLPFLHQRGRDAVVILASPHGLHWTSAADDSHINPHFTRDTPRVPMLSPVDQGRGDMVPQRGLSSPSSDPGCRSRRQGLNGGLLRWPQENLHGRCQRLPEPQLPPSHMENSQNWSPSEVSVSPFDIVRPSSQSQCSGSYTVLPPIGKLLSGGEPELSSGHCGQSEETQRKNPIPRSCSDGYLAQMEKQRQLAERATYKPYTLKDYKYLKQDINLRGLGPDRAAIEKTKMRRQKLYSNVIREQNKKISRIPFLPAKELESSDKNVPRRKALEYARNIAKPQILPQPIPKPKQKPPSKGPTQNAPYLGGLDLSQLTTLELLRKRHEEEKLVVARFRNVH